MTSPGGQQDTEDEVWAADPLFRTLVVVVVVAVVAWAIAILVWPDAPFALTYDDAYYYFTIARNIAHGLGSTFDQVNLTNGYHPLWMAISVVPFKAGLDDLAAARALLLVQIVLGWGVSLVLVASIVARAVDGWSRVSRREEWDNRTVQRAATVTLAIGMALLAINPFVVKVIVNGMESGVAVTLDALVLWAATRIPDTASRRGRMQTSWIARSHQWRLAMGALLALTYLGRTDSVLLLGCLGLWCLAEVATSHELRLGERWVALVELLAPALAVIVVYAAWNNATFGTPWQVSGLVKRAEINGGHLAVFAMFLLVAAAAGWHGFRRSHGLRARRRGRFHHAGRFAARTAWFGAFCILLTGYYTVLQTQLWPWYFAPLVLYGIILFLLALTDAVEAALRTGRPERNPEKALLPMQLIFFTPLVLAMIFQIPAFTDPNLLSIQTANRDAGVWMKDNLPAGSVVASWDAGILGYFSHGRVVNLDGVVNSYDYYQAARKGATARFLCNEGVRYIANHGDNTNGEDPDIRAYLKSLYGKDVADRAKIIYTGPFIYSGTTTGSSGSSGGGPRPLAVHVYQFDPGACP